MIRTIFVNFSARLAMQVMNFFTLLLTTNTLGSEVRGEISIIQLAINMIHLISDVVGGPALVYMVPRARLSVLLFTGWSWAIVSCSVVGFILTQYELMPTTYSSEILIASFLLSLNSINLNILLGQERMKAYNALLFLQGGLMFLTMAASIFILNHDHSLPYLEACFGAYGGTFLLGLYFVLKEKHIPKLTDSRPILIVLFANGFFTQIATLTHQLSIRQNYYYLDNMIHDKKSSVGIYSTAISLGEAILLFSASVAAVLMSRVSNEKLTEVSRKQTLRLAKLSLAVTIPGILLFVILPPDFYTWLLGKDFSGVHRSFMTIAPGIILVSFGTVFGHFFSGTGRHYMNFLSGIFGLCITLLTVRMLVTTYGVEGAGWSASIAYGGMSLFIFIMFMLVGRKHSGEWREILPTHEDVASLKRIFKSEAKNKQ